MRAASAQIASEIRVFIGHVGGSPYSVCRGPIEINSSLVLEELEDQGALDAVVSDAESISQDVPARRRRTAMPGIACS